jgi:hypothetical protein
MRHFLIFTMITVSIIFSSCVKSTSSQEYDSIWKPHSGTSWIKSSSSLGNFVSTAGGFKFDATITPVNQEDTTALMYSFYADNAPSWYVVSNIESASNAVITAAVNVSSIPDTMNLVAGGTTLFQFGRVNGAVRTFGSDSVLTQPRKLQQNTLLTYSPSIRPDSCSRQLRIDVALNWNKYNGASAIDTIKSKKITIEVSNVSFGVYGIDILK